MLCKRFVSCNTDSSYHPSSDALGTILWDLPFKAAQTISMNLTLYFMSNLRRTPGHFFFFLFDAFLIFMTMTFL
jgi:ATP-binding cassette subfamily G (WHITE) protein 2 (PDR)